MTSAAPADAHFDALETRVRRRARGGAAGARCRRRSRTRSAHAPAFARAAARRRSRRRSRSRAALAAPAGAAQARPARAASSAADAADAFGGFADRRLGRDAPPAQRALRVFASPGPIHEPESGARRLLAHGARPVRRRLSRRRPGPQQLQLPPHARRLDDGKRRARDRLHRLSRPAPARPSCSCRRWPRCAPDAYAGTPSFLRLLLEKADETGVAVPSLAKASLERRGGAAGAARLARRRAASPPTRRYGTADLGLVAYETAAREGLVVDEGVVVEIVRPGTGDPVADGEVGEIVVTTLNPDYPLIRFAHRRPLGGAAGRLPDRPHQPAHPRLARPRRPVDQGARHVRPSVAGGRDRAPPSRDRRGRGWSSSGAMADDRMTLRVEAARRVDGLGRAGRARRSAT